MARIDEAESADTTCGRALQAGDIVTVHHFEDDRDIGTARVVEVVPGEPDEWCEARVTLAPVDAKAPQPATLYRWSVEGAGHYQDGTRSGFYLELAR